jgi:hypothetical protein
MELYVRSESVVSRVIAGETLIVPISKGVGDLASIYSLNPVATTIWDAISCPRSKREILQVIASEFESESAEIERDLETFLGEMESVGLVMAVRMAALS